MATDWSCKDLISVGIMLVINNHYLSVFQLDVHGYRLVLQGLDLCGDTAQVALEAIQHLLHPLKSILHSTVMVVLAVSIAAKPIQQPPNKS